MIITKKWLIPGYWFIKNRVFQIGTSKIQISINCGSYLSKGTTGKQSLFDDGVYKNYGVELLIKQK